MDRAWAINARTGEQKWSYFFKTRGGHHGNGSKGMGMYGGWLYFETPDCYLVSLEAKTGKERWYKQIAPVEKDYFGSTAPLVVGNHVYTGAGGDAIDIQGYLDARDPETGDVQWRWFTTPQNAGDPGYDTWPDDYSRRHGGAGPWQPLTYDPSAESGLCHNRQSESGGRDAKPKGRQSVHVFDCGAESRHRENGLVL